MAENEQGTGGTDLMNDETPPERPTVQSGSAPVYMVHPGDQEEGIDLLDIVDTLWQGKAVVVLVTLLVVVPALAYAFLADPVYRAEAVLIPNDRDSGQNMPAGMAGLAGLAGINIGSSDNTAEVVATLSSRVFIEEFINDENLLPILFEDEWDGANERWRDEDPEEWPDVRDGVKLFTEEVRFVDENSGTGLVTLAIEWTDAELVADWVGKLTARVNDRIRNRDLRESEQRLQYLNAQLQNANLVELRMAISRLIEGEVQTMTLAQAETEYAFKTIDPPRVPIEPVAPQRILIAILSVILGGFLGVMTVLFRSAARGPQDRTP